MASSLEFVEYVSEQIKGAGNITFKKMFGEYGLYCDGKYFALICDNQFFIKITKAGQELLPNGELAPPYNGAKPCFLIIELEDREFLAELITKTCAELPMPKPRKKKVEKEKGED